MAVLKRERNGALMHERGVRACTKSVRLPKTQTKKHKQVFRLLRNRCMQSDSSSRGSSRGAIRFTFRSRPGPAVCPPPQGRPRAANVRFFEITHYHAHYRAKQI